jgi:hypothetical protein
VSAYQRSGLEKIPQPDFIIGEPPGENQPALSSRGMGQLLKPCAVVSENQLRRDFRRTGVWSVTGGEMLTRAAYLALRGSSGEREPTFAFFAWLAHGLPSWRSGFGQDLRPALSSRAQVLREAAKPDRLSPCQQSKTVSSKDFEEYAATTTDNVR